MLKAIPYIILLAALSAWGQGTPGGLFYDIGLMIEDSTKTTTPIEEEVGDQPELTQEQEVLEEELNRYQQKLAETEIRLKYQTGVIDSLQNEIAMIKAANETDKALLSSRISDLQDRQEQSRTDRQFIAITNQTPDSVFAELHTPWKVTQPIRKQHQAVVQGPPLSASEAQTAYRNGLTKFHRELYYQAIDEFNLIVMRGSDRTMMANAQYWVGRCYYEKGLYDEAIAALELVQRYPQSDKLDDALVMIGLAFKNKNRMPEAKLAFQELVSRHPGSEYLTLARRFVQD